MKQYIYAFLCLAGSIAQAQSPKTVFQSPSLSPDGKQIAFSFQGDVWTVPSAGGQARRLTIHEGYDGTPLWSPDGQQIAFASDRFGNDDIFAMPASGGAPKRLTFHSATDKPTGWTPDGGVIFSTRRLFVQVEREWEIHLVPATGGTPMRYLDALGGMASVSPNGQLVAFVRNHGGIDREAYRGPANLEVWVFNRATGEYHAITNFDGNDFQPLWGGNRTLFFISSKTGSYNIFQQALNDAGAAQGDAKAVTSFTSFGPQHFHVNAQGNLLVFERFGEIFTQTIGGQPALVNIEVTHDNRFDQVEHLTLSNGATEYAVAPNGKLVAFGIRGEIFAKLVDKEHKRSANISQHAYRDRDASWVNDSTLLFASDRDGQYELYMSRSDDAKEGNLFKALKHKEYRLTQTPLPERAPKVSPDGKKVAFLRGNEYGPNQLIIADIDLDGKQLKNERIMHDGWQTMESVAWSPDSRWIAYVMEDLTFNDEIYIQPADNSLQPINVSMHPRSDGSPVWSPDGSKLAFLSQRSNSGFDVWFVWLKKSDWEKTQPDWEEDELESEKADKKGKVEVAIDFDDMHYRLAQATSMPGDEGEVAISKDGKSFFFTGASSNKPGANDLYTVKWDGKELKSLTSNGANPSNLALCNGGNHLYYLQRGVLQQLDVKSSKIEALPHTAHLSVNHPAEREQIFEEAWHALFHGFYDPQFHGQDWEKLKKQYKEVAIAASTNRDFRHYFNQMLGQLNASHMGLYGSDEHETQREETGLIGAEVAPEAMGARVKRIIPGSPADREQSKLKVGDLIKKIDGQPVSQGINMYSLLINTANTKVLLEIERDGKTVEMAIRPTSSLSNALYEEWVKTRKALVEKYSNGELGYIHIQGMNLPSFERFERELTASGLNKKGLLIDVRFNGGGWTTDYLMAVLNVKQHAYTIPRGAAKSLDEHERFRNYYPFGERLPFGVWNKPSVALCNEASYSNAEIFSHAYKSLGIGKLVGIPTYGAVISTGATFLIDGSRVRMPFRAWFVKNSGMNMENGPAVPDVVVANGPASKAKGEDEQLKKAVEVLLQQLQK